MDLSTTYMGFRLPHPFMPGASPLVDDVEKIRRLEDAGPSAITLPSLFEEQITGEELAVNRSMELAAESFAEASSFLPNHPEFTLGPDEYLELIRRVKAAVGVPVFASLNGSTEGGWLHYARLMEEAGADAVELNVYELATDLDESGASVEQRLVGVLRAVKGAVDVPVAVKLSPYFSSIAHMASRLETAGADALVLFNRFYQPDIDVEELEVLRSLQLSESGELLLRLRWLAILWGRVQPSLAVTGGIHTAPDAIKAIMAGSHAVQMVSALLRHGPEQLRVVREAVAAWLEEHEYESLEQMQGSMSLARCPDPKAFERANYMHILQSWEG